MRQPGRGGQLEPRCRFSFHSSVRASFSPFTCLHLDGGAWRAPPPLQRKPTRRQPHCSERRHSACGLVPCLYRQPQLLLSAASHGLPPVNRGRRDAREEADAAQFNLQKSSCTTAASSVPTAKAFSWRRHSWNEGVPMVPLCPRMPVHHSAPPCIANGESAPCRGTPEYSGATALVKLGWRMQRSQHKG